MAYVPSHQELRDHPKTRKASRHAGVSLPAMIGHLHLLWWWALDHAPDGDLSKFDADDLADAALWEGDPETFVRALRDCGPGGSDGFLDGDGKLHDWDSYGGKYGQRVAAARKAAAVRWNSEPDATAMRTHNDRNADALQGQCGDDAEERREEEKDLPSPDGDVDEAAEQFEEHFWPTYPPRNGRKVEKGKALTQWRKLTLEERRRALIGARNLAASDTLPKDAHRFLRKDTAGEFPFDDWQTSVTRLQQANKPAPPPRPCPQCGDQYVPDNFDGGVPASHGCETGETA